MSHEPKTTKATAARAAPPEAEDSVEAYLGRVPVSEDDPALVLDWDQENLQRFAAALNAYAHAGAPAPPIRPNLNAPVCSAGAGHNHVCE